VYIKTQAPPNFHSSSSRPTRHNRFLITSPALYQTSRHQDLCQATPLHHTTLHHTTPHHTTPPQPQDHLQNGRLWQRFLLVRFVLLRSRQLPVWRTFTFLVIPMGVMGSLTDMLNRRNEREVEFASPSWDWHDGAAGRRVWLSTRER